MRENIRAWLKLLLLLSDEAIVIFAVLFILWKVGVQLPTALLVAILIIVAVIVFFLHWILLPVLKDGKLPTKSSMIGMKGEVITRLSPEGVVKVRGELWQAVAENAEVEVGQKIKVVGREGLKLRVKVQGPDVESGASSQASHDP